MKKSPLEHVNYDRLSLTAVSTFCDLLNEMYKFELVKFRLAVVKRENKRISRIQNRYQETKIDEQRRNCLFLFCISKG